MSLKSELKRLQKLGAKVVRSRGPNLRRVPGILPARHLQEHPMNPVQPAREQSIAPTDLQLPDYLKPWARMTRDELKTWAGTEGSRWMRARYFGRLLIRFGLVPFPQ